MSRHEIMAAILGGLFVIVFLATPVYPSQGRLPPDSDYPQPPPPPRPDNESPRRDARIEFELTDYDPSMQPIPVVSVKPHHPLRATERGFEGAVIVRFDITPEGAMNNPEIVWRTSPIFSRAALRAISQFEFEPNVVNGIPETPENMLYMFDFRLEGRSSQ